MSLLDEARALEYKSGSSCAMQRIKEQDPALHAEIIRALASDLTCASIARAIDKRNEKRTEDDPPPIPVNRDILERHRRGDCRRCRA